MVAGYFQLSGCKLHGIVVRGGSNQGGNLHNEEA
ncbi:hypothetical protein PSECIP111951_02175 [Pseudoalteromonas holothuriae]|uniref:Uncharacterized protein n=1 Tax=Pseudoalteromonas holothuriae TaxID=2963714 RepID=A0A9W4QS69_9GAMM|nr:hypothetical protein PSECIP111854_00627 [Pseudoalteromonas sp. CIP111854]CAH9059965.1 hypothetical protein PSECIP111951_02175 [Pseudoalteromonas sp. CIP111951]